MLIHEAVNLVASVVRLDVMVARGQGMAFAGVVGGARGWRAAARGITLTYHIVSLACPGAGRHTKETLSCCTLLTQGGWAHG
jgi:hypothetical protein